MTNATTTQPAREAGSHSLLWMAASISIVVIICVALRAGTHVLQLGPVYDERYISAPILDIIELGWSVETAIDFVETKGPGMIWPYALINTIIGHELNDLRLTSCMFFLAGFIPILLLAKRCELQRHELMLVAAGYAMLPYHAILSQLVMSEASFVCGSALLMWVFITARDSNSRRMRVFGVLLFGIVLSILLHHRVHAVALAGAVCLTAFERDRWRSWPWWVACIVAGLSRIPLWLRWEGLVAPPFQGPHSLGLSPEGLAYLGATLTPFVGVMLVYVLIHRRRFAQWWLSLAGMAAGLCLALFAMPDLTAQLPLLDSEVLRFMGITATFTRRIAGDNGLLADALLGLFMIVGLGGLGALGAVAFGRRAESHAGVVLRLAFWSLTCGWLLYLLTGSVVYDRYPLAWAALLPIVWTRELPRWLLCAHLLVLAAVAGVFTYTWLM